MDGYQTAEEAKEGHAKMVEKYKRATTIEGRPTARDITEHLASLAEQYELGAGWGDMTLRAFCEAVEAKRGGK